MTHIPFNITPLDIIQTKADAFKARLFDVLDLLPKQKQAMHILTDNSTRELLYGGAAGGAKSWLGCEWLFWSCMAYPNSRWFVARYQLTQIRDSTVVTLNKVLDKHGYPKELMRYDSVSVQFTFHNGSVINGEETVYKPTDKDYDRFGSVEYTGGWIEEAAQVPAEAADTLRTRTGRHMNDLYGLNPSKLLVTSNPSKNWIHKRYYKPYKDGTLDKDKAFIQAFVHDNTKVDKGYKENLDSLKGQKRERLLLGNFNYDSSEAQLAKDDAIQDLFTNSFITPDKSRRCIIADVALHGSDLFRIGYFEGDVLMESVRIPKSGGKDVLNAVQRIQNKYSVPNSHIVYDADGVGGFLGNKGGFIPNAVPFNGGAAPIIRTPDDKKYFNLKSQCAYLLCDDINEYRLYAKAVTDETEQELLTEELAQIKEVQGIDKMRIISKEEVKQNIGRSPDFSDIFVMKKYFDIMPRIKKHVRQLA